MSSILQFLAALFQWQYFGLLAILWVVIDLVWVDRWKSLIGRLGKLITKPWIFTKDKEPNDPPLYPRLFLEQLALNTSRESSTDFDPKTRSGDTFQRWINAQNERVFDVYNPLRSLGYVLALTFFGFFLLSDTIIISNTMVLLGLMSPDLPSILQRLDLAILGGALLSAVVGIWMLVEMSGEGTLTNTDVFAEVQKKILRLFSAITVLFSVVVMTTLAIQRLLSLGYLQSTPTADLILSFASYGVLAINCSLSAALLFQSAASGLLVTIYLLIVLIVGLLPVLVFVLDVLWRMAYIIIDTLLWVAFTPIIAIPYGVTKILGFRMSSRQ